MSGREDSGASIARITDAGVAYREDGTRTFVQGHTASVKHEGRSTPALLAARHSDEHLAIVAGIEDLCADLPAGRPAFALAREVLADKVLRYRVVVRNLADRGLVDDDGALLPAAELPDRLLSAIEKTLDTLGLNPTSAARLGVDVVRGASLAQALQTLDDAEVKP